MSLQEKINNRIEKLEINIKSIEETNYPGIWKATQKLNLTSQCIKELKSLLNN